MKNKMRNLIISLITFVFTISLYAQPNTITYQGVLTDNSGAIVADANYNLVFSLYTTSDGSGVAAWSETHTNTTVSKGMFSVELGGTTTFASASVDFSNQYYLKINVNGTDLTPLIKFNAAGYSMNSAKANALKITTNAGAGKVLTSDAQGNGSWQEPARIKIKTSNTTVNNSTALAYDPELYVNWGYNNPGVYIVDFYIIANGYTCGIKGAVDAINNGSGNVLSQSVISYCGYIEYQPLNSAFGIIGTNTANAQIPATIRVMVKVDSGISGVKLKWAQEIADGTNLATIYSSSYVTYQKISE
jgi:hypothetical protein